MALRVCILTPDRIFRDERADELILPTSTGQIGVLSNHAPLITAVDIGLIIVRQQSNWIALALIGGFALVQENQVTILVNEAVEKSTIKVNEVEKEIEEAKDRMTKASGEKEKVEATFSFKRARARYQVMQWKKSFLPKNKFLKFTMSKYCGPRLRIVRRLGSLLALTRKTRKRDTQPGQHGVSRKKLTQFAFRLIEKQKLRFYYGISEAQLTRYVKEARKSKGPTGRILLQKIEIRLDTILYRLNWAPTLPFARQIINHGHIIVQRKRVTIPSFSCLPRYVISVRETRKSNRLIEKNFEIQNMRLPSHLTLDIANGKAIVNQYVDRKRIPLELNELLVIEYYSNRL